MPTATILNGTVKYGASKPKDFGNGPRINVVIAAGNEEIKVWGNEGDPALASLRKGQAVTLVHDGKNYRLAETAETASASSHAAPIDAEAAFNELLKRNAIRMDRALSAAQMVAAKKLGITAAQITSSTAAAAIVKEIGVTLFIQATKDLP